MANLAELENDIDRYYQDVIMEQQEKYHSTNSTEDESQTSAVDTEEETSYSQVLRRRNKKRKTFGSPPTPGFQTSFNQTLRPATPKKSKQYFAIVACINTEIKLGSQNPIKLQKALSHTVGIVKAMKATRAGHLFVECFDAPQWRQLQDSTRLGEWQIRVSLPKSATSSVGVIYNVPSDLSDEEIVDVLKEQKVSKIQRLTYFDKQSRTRVPSKSVKLFFSCQELPDYVVIGFRRYRVKVFVPKAIQCYNCQGFGHMKGECRNNTKCIKCGKSHPTEQCTAESLVCANCKGNHASTDKSCPAKKQKQEILKIAKTEKISMTEAKKELNKMNKTSEKPKTDKLNKKQNRPVPPTMKVGIQEVATLVSVAIHKLTSPLIKPEEMTLVKTIDFVTCIVQEVFDVQIDSALAKQMANKCTSELI